MSITHTATENVPTCADDRILRSTGRPKKNHPSEALAALLKSYYAQGMNGFVEINKRLVAEHPEYAFSRSYYRVTSELKIGSRKSALKGEELKEEMVLSLSGADCKRGFRGTTHALRLRGKQTNQLSVLKALREFDPDGIEGRQLGKKQRIRRFPINSGGSNEQWSIDGHDKLTAWGFAIYGIRDVFSGKLLALHAMPSNRLAVNPYWLYLRTIMRAGGIPIQVVSDRGSETGLIIGVQTRLRDMLAEGGLEDYPPHAFLPSTRNTPIERAWRPVHKEVVAEIKDSIQQGLKTTFVPSNKTHWALYLWLYIPLVQEALDYHVRFHNSYRTRRQKQKLNPSGAAPDHIYRDPQHWGRQECLQRFGDDETRLVAETFNLATEEAQLKWLDEDVHNVIQLTFDSLDGDHPPHNLKHVWDLFRIMLPLVEFVLESNTQS